MTNEQLVEKFNPANGANLSAEDLAIMKNLTDEQIGILAKAYPNTPGRRSYIRLYDTAIKPEKQIFQLSTWQNLNNLRKFSNKKNLVPYDYQTPGAKVNQPKPMTGRAARLNAAAPKRVLVDLTAQEAANELTASIQKQKAAKSENTAEVKETFQQKMERGKREKAEREAAKAAKQTPEKTEVPADQDFDAGTE